MLKISRKTHGQNYYQFLHHSLIFFSIISAYSTGNCLLFLVGLSPQLTRSSVTADGHWLKQGLLKTDISNLHIFKKKKNSQKLKSSFWCSLIIDQYQSKPDQYIVTGGVSKAGKSGGLAYLTLTWHCMLRLCKGKGKCVWVCAILPACCTEPSASMFTHTSLHALVFYTGWLHSSKTIQVQPLLYFEGMQDMCWAPVFNSVSWGAPLCVCMCMLVETKVCERDYLNL